MTMNQTAHNQSQWMRNIVHNLDQALSQTVLAAMVYYLLASVVMKTMESSVSFANFVNLRVWQETLFFGWTVICVACGCTSTVHSRRMLFLEDINVISVHLNFFVFFTVYF